MPNSNIRMLHWTQRIALVRHNLHAASRSGDFGFFKAVQASGMMEGTNHSATLTAMLGDEADVILAAMDNLNGGLAYIHQDAFQTVLESLKNSMRDDDQQADRSKLYVDINMEKKKTEMAIDKLCNSATALIQQQSSFVQEEAANVFITGVTFIADCIEVVVKQLDGLDQKMDDFIRLEESWNTVKASVIAATAGLKGVFWMLDATDPQGEQAPRSQSIASTGSNMLRRLSTAFQSSSSSTGPSRAASIASAGAPPPPIYRTPTYVRNSVSAGCPTSMPPSSMMNNHAAFNQNSFAGAFGSRQLSTIPPTPAHDEDLDPFDNPALIDVPPVPALPIEMIQSPQVAV
jgi:hypothetical protein